MLARARHGRVQQLAREDLRRRARAAGPRRCRTATPGSCGSSSRRRSRRPRDAPGVNSATSSRRSNAALTRPPAAAHDHARVAVVQAQPVVVLGHEQRAPGVPLALGARSRAPRRRASARSAPSRSRRRARRDGARRAPGTSRASRWRRRASPRRAASITARAAATAPSRTGRRASESGRVRRGRPSIHVTPSTPAARAVDRRIGVAAPDGVRELGDPLAVAMDAVEDDDAVADRGVAGGAARPATSWRRHPGQTRPRGRAHAEPGGGRPDDVAEHRARLDRGELPGVADEDQPRLRAHRLDESGHQRQRDHRGLVDDHDVVRQPVRAVVAEPAVAAGLPAEEPVERRRVELASSCSRTASPTSSFGRLRRAPPPRAVPRPCRSVRRARRAAPARPRRRPARRAARRSGRRSSSCRFRGRRRRPRAAAAPRWRRRGAGGRRAGVAGEQRAPRPSLSTSSSSWPAAARREREQVRRDRRAPRASSGRGRARCRRGAAGRAAVVLLADRHERAAGQPRDPRVRRRARRARTGRPAPRIRPSRCRGSSRGRRRRGRAAAPRTASAAASATRSSASPASAASRSATWTSAAASTPASLNSRSSPAARRRARRTSNGSADAVGSRRPPRRRARR